MNHDDTASRQGLAGAEPRRTRMAVGLADPKLRERATAGKCIALTRASSFMALCRNDARPDGLYCAKH